MRERYSHGWTGDRKFVVNGRKCDSAENAFPVKAIQSSHGILISNLYPVNEGERKVPSDK